MYSTYFSTNLSKEKMRKRKTEKWLTFVIKVYKIELHETYLIHNALIDHLTLVSMVALEHFLIVKMVAEPWQYNIFNQGVDRVWTPPFLALQKGGDSYEYIWRVYDNSDYSVTYYCNSKYPKQEIAPLLRTK